MIWLHLIESSNKIVMVKKILTFHPFKVSSSPNSPQLFAIVF